MAKKGGLNAKAFGYAGAVIAAACTFLLGIGANMGIYYGAAQQMMGRHMFFSFSTGGIIAGAIEAAVWGFVFAYVFAWLYNKWA